MSDGLRNDMKITVDSTGAVAGAGGPSDSVPWQVSRNSQVEISPFQSVSNFAADRQLRFSREIAIEIARDRQAVREIEEAVLRKQAQGQLEVASMRRAAEMARRDRMLTLVRRRDDDVDDGRFERKMSSRARSVAKSSLRQLGRGAIAGALVSSITPDGGGLAGSLARIAGDTIAGAAFGGAPGAAFSAIWAGITELRTLLGQQDRELHQMREQALEIRLKVEAEIDSIKEGFARIEREFQEAFDKFVRDSIEKASINSYRQTRDIALSMVP